MQTTKMRERPRVGHRFVLCATDLSPGAAVALRWADELARFHDARFGALLVTPTPLGPHSVDPQRSGESYAQVPRAQTPELAALASHVSEHLSAQGPGPELWVDHGTPDTAIVQRAAALNADLLVLGANGRSGPKPAFGSVTTRVLRHAPCSVLVARQPVAGPVVAATDFSEAALRAVKAAADEAERRGVGLSVVHSIGPLVNLLVPVEVPGEGWPASGAISPERHVAVRRDAQARLEDLRREIGVACELLVSEGDAAADLATIAEVREAVLLALGGVGRAGLPRLLLGSVAEEVVRRARCSLLVVR
jgi:nucleotide-binding universal stress UspA family protein